jgi:hypothetical protein
VAELDPVGWKQLQPRHRAEDMRESVYLPEHDLVLFLGYQRREGAIDRTLVYDAARNAWRSLRFKPDVLPGPGSRTRRLYAAGLMYHPGRKLVFAVVPHGYRSGFVYVMRFDPKTAEWVKVDGK